MITILHIIQDNKFNNVFKRFERDDRLINKKALILPRKDYKFNYINSTEGITLLYGNKCIKKFFSEESYDVIWFHSLDIEQYKAFKYIPHDKKIVWWAWGWDIYDSFYGLRPLVEIPLLKPKTNSLVKRRKNWKEEIKELIKKNIVSCYAKRLQNSVISRIDYFVPVLPIEYKLMKNNSLFRAEEFYYPVGDKKSAIPIWEKKGSRGAILLGNSASYSMNHIDILEKLNSIGLSDRELVIPLNYGDTSCANDVKKALQDLSMKATVLEEFMPQQEYYEAVNRCSYAIFGMIRQQAMANVNYCLKHGIKLFLYRDSIPYRFLTSNGALVFSIEEMTLESLLSPLNDQDNMHNLDVLVEINRKRKMLYEKGIEKIEGEIERGN